MNQGDAALDASGRLRAVRDRFDRSFAEPLDLAVHEPRGYGRPCYAPYLLDPNDLMLEVLGHSGP